MHGFCCRNIHPKQDHGAEDVSTSSSDEEDDTYSTLSRRSELVPAATPGTERFVLEIVGASGLSTLADDVNTFCVVSRKSSNGKVTMLHRTSTIKSDTAPIWTLKTKSICFVQVDKSQPSEKIQIELCRRTVGIPGMRGKSVIGAVVLTYPILLANGNSKRHEYPVAPDKYPKVQLALRFRKATPQDWNSFQELQVGRHNNIIRQGKRRALDREKEIPSWTTYRRKEDHAGDIDFEFVSQKGIIGNYTTVMEEGKPQTAYRVWPFPDPENPKETTFMTKAKIQRVAMEPSRTWVEAAGGAGDNYGSIFLEVLGCDDLPNMVGILNSMFLVFGMAGNLIRHFS